MRPVLGMMTDAERLERNLAWMAELPDGWQDLYRDVIRDIASIDAQAQVVQAKEKFGEMRVYMKTYSEPVFALIDAATGKSRKLWQTCGSPGVLSKTRDGFYATVCPDHSERFEPANLTLMRHVRFIVASDDDEAIDPEEQ